MPGDCIVCQSASPIDVAPGGEILERTHAKMARRDSAKHSPRKNGLAHHLLPRRHGSQGPGGRNADRRHGLAHDVLAQYRPECGPAVAAAGERGWAGTFKLNVVAHTI